MDKNKDLPLAPRGKSNEVAAFVEAARRVPAPSQTRGRLIFALDATMSRQPTWDLAQSLQGSMFEAAAGRWRPRRATRLFPRLERMPRLELRFGRAGARRAHEPDRGARRQDADPPGARPRARRGQAARKVGALVFVGDAMEESPDPLPRVAGELALAGVKAFMFQEGGRPAARRAFQEIARLTGGAYGAFDAGAAARLEALLRAAAAYAAGGQAALASAGRADADARPLLAQMRGVKSA